MRTVPVLLLLAACGGGTDVEGIWLLELPPATAAECTETILHNFTGAYLPEEDAEDTGDPWTYTDTGDESGSLQFVQIVRGEKDRVFLRVGNGVYPGSGAKGSYTFSWTDFSDDTSVSEHTSGYSWLEEQQTETVRGFDFLVGKWGTGSGSSSSTSTRKTEYNESDRWSDDVWAETGQIDTYLGELTVVDDLGEETGASNNRENTDCDTDPCLIRTETVCSSGYDFTATWVGYESDDIYDELRDAGEPGI